MKTNTSFGPRAHIVSSQYCCMVMVRRIVVLHADKVKLRENML
jgi:hypothetical protein